MTVLRHQEKNAFRPGQVDRVLRLAGLIPCDRRMLGGTLLEIGALMQHPRFDTHFSAESTAYSMAGRTLERELRLVGQEKKVAIKREADALVKRTARIGRVLGAVLIGVSIPVVFGEIALLGIVIDVHTWQFFSALGISGAGLLVAVVLLGRIMNGIEDCAHRIRNEIDKHLKPEP